MKTRRFTIEVPLDLYDEMKSIADKQSSSFVYILRMFIKIGLLVNRINDDPNSELIIRENGKDSSVVLFIH